MLRTASTRVNCNSFFIWRPFSSPFVRRGERPGQGSENHPDFRSGRKAFFELILD